MAYYQSRCKKVQENLPEKLVNTEKMRTFASAIERDADKTNLNFGALVQLVRIHACHAWGHGFESRTHRFLKKQNKEKS